jgi:hypothetical protein
LPDFSWYNNPKREKYTKSPQKMPNGHKIYLHFPFQDPPKFTQSWIFGLKMYHLATLSHAPAKIALPEPKSL